ncbi:glycosyltransferase family 9 protein [OM182 bacterium]|jgi:ADP-heptose:LPS heptosyltransferase|nr:glycosyltransferase family 9 protein [OM182 bacterium]
MANNMKGKNQKILLFPTHYLGNFILGLPWIISAIDEEPATIVVLDSRFKPFIQLALNDHTNVLEYPRNELKNNQISTLKKLNIYLSFLSKLRGFKSTDLFDLEGERFTGVLSRLSGAKNRFGPIGKNSQIFYTNPLALDFHKHRFNAFGQTLSDRFSVNKPTHIVDYQIRPTAKNNVTNFLAINRIKNSFVVIHPGASANYKKWPVEKFAQLYKMLKALGVDVVWIGMDEDQKIVEKISSILNNENLNQFTETKYSELIALLKRAEVFIGSDSGPMHLAASVGIGVIALFGPSVESIWAPLGLESRVIRGSKRCGKNCDAHRCDFNHHCLTSLNPESVLSAVTAIQISKIIKTPSNSP